MDWKEVLPGQYERPLDDIEIFFKIIADQGAALNREHWAVGVCAQLQCKSLHVGNELAFRKAWMAMRYEHPEIASWIKGDQKVYNVPSPEALNAWMEETFHVEPAITAYDMFSKARPSRLANFYYLPNSSEILILSSHWRIDGIGALHLLNNYLKALVSPRPIRFGDEWQRLSPGLSAAANLSRETSTNSSQIAAEILSQYKNNLPSVGLLTQIEGSNPGETRLAKLIFLPQTTLDVISACKQQGYSVTTAVHAALIVATRDTAPEGTESRKYTSWGAINLRPYLRQPFNQASHAVSVYLVGYPISVTAQSFQDNAAQLGDIYTQFSTPDPDFELETCLTPYIKEATALFSQPPSGDTPAPTEPILDSLGIVDRYVQQSHGDDVEITDFWLASETLFKQIGLYIWTWHGRLVFHACYNAAFYQADYVKMFLEKVKSILLTELNIGLEQ